MLLSEARILLLTGAMSGGGAERSFCRIAPLIGGSPSRRLLVCLRHGEAAWLGSEPVLSLGWRSWRDYPKAACRLEQLLQRHEVDVLYSFSRCPDLVAYLATRRVRRKVVWVCGVNDRPCVALRSDGLFRGTVWAAALRRVYAGSAAVLCNSATAAEDVRALSCGRPIDCRVVRNPVPLETIRTAAALAREGGGYPPFLLSVARMEKDKGLQTVIEAFASIACRRPERLLILGDGPLRPELVKLAERLGVANRVDMPGWIDHPIPYFARCSAFLFASRHEGFPNVVLEAMASGVPVVSTRCTSWIDIFGSEGACIPIPVGDSGGLASEVLKLLGEPGRATALRSRAAEVVERFSARAAAAERNELLAELLEYGTPHRKAH